MMQRLAVQLVALATFTVTLEAVLRKLSHTDRGSLCTGTAALCADVLALLNAANVWSVAAGQAALCHSAP